MTVPPISAAAFATEVQRFLALMTRDYQASPAELFASRSDRLLEKRLWRTLGVSMKVDYSDARGRLPSKATRAVFAYDIDRAKLDQKVRSGAWEIDLLGGLDARRPDETIEQLAIRLKTETRFGAALRKTVHRYVCGDPAIRVKVVKALKAAKLEHLEKTLTPEGLISAGAIMLSSELATVMPHLVAATPVLVGLVVVIATLGLSTICPAEETTPKAVRVRRKPTG